LPASTAAEELVTLGTAVVTAFAAGSSALVIEGVTVSEGGPAEVINGETVSLNGTQLVVASGSSTTTEGLGGAIMSGLGAWNVAGGIHRCCWSSRWTTELFCGGSGGLSWFN
jgi:hypothetical protein